MDKVSLDSFVWRTVLLKRLNKIELISGFLSDKIKVLEILYPVSDEHHPCLLKSRFRMIKIHSNGFCDAYFCRSSANTYFEK